jgi:hypothetical protein
MKTRYRITFRSRRRPLMCDWVRLEPNGTVLIARHQLPSGEVRDEFFDVLKEIKSVTLSGPNAKEQRKRLQHDPLLDIDGDEDEEEEDGDGVLPPKRPTKLDPDIMFR